MNVLLCSSDPILVKSLYGLLRDEGHAVETFEHPAFAVQKVIEKKIDCVIIDSEPFGLSAEDAAVIIGTVSPGTRVLLIGESETGKSGGGREEPFDLEEFKRSLHRIAV
jgi:DNA-binding NtrC family response regulator